MQKPRLLPIGDQGVMAYCVDEASAQQFAVTVRARNEPWLVDVVQAYTSVAVFFDLEQIGVAEVLQRLGQLDPVENALATGATHVIPCCYEFGLDLERVATHTELSVDEVIRRHAAIEYTVYAIGFCPGFPYLGYLPEELTGVPRLATPRVRLEAGSIGLTGRQTGIYTEARPGGWNIIGRTPLKLVDVAAGYFPLRTGDRIRFEAIGRDDFDRRKGRRLVT